MEDLIKNMRVCGYTFIEKIQYKDCGEYIFRSWNTALIVKYNIEKDSEMLAVVESVSDEKANSFILGAEPLMVIIKYFDKVEANGSK